MMAGGVYISYPFCDQKCTFCNFASGVFASDLREQYKQRLLEEIRAHDWRWRPETLYLGGGTPSLMPSEFVKALAKLLRDRSGADDWTEATMEAAPGTMSADLVSAWRECGINRVSLGVQSAINGELRTTGRTYSAETVQADVELLRRMGIDNISVDLIAGMPQQTAASWATSLELVEMLDVPHVSVYIFETDEDSKLGREVLRSGLRYGAGQMPSDDLIADLYETAVARLSRSGWVRYEISNFARPGWASHHNLKYWRLHPYVGFGLDAHSFVDGLRWRNSDNLAEYTQRNEPVETERPDAESEQFFVGLRLMEGIRPSQEARARFAEPLRKWTREGKLIDDGSTVRLAPEAILLSNEILADFVGTSFAGVAA